MVIHKKLYSYTITGVNIIIEMISQTLLVETGQTVIEKMKIW